MKLILERWKKYLKEATWDDLEPSPYVARVPGPDACKHCQRLFLNSEGYPIIFTAEELEENGTNKGRKSAEWRPTLGAMHPHCKCVTVSVPPGMYVSPEGDLIPGGE